MPKEEIFPIPLEYIDVRSTHTDLDVMQEKRVVNFPTRGNPSRDENQSKHTNTNSKLKRHGNRDNDELSDVDHVVASAKPSHFEAMLYIFEDNEAVIKMITKGRSPTLRHVSRTHRVALDWLYDRINLETQIQIRR